MIAMLLTPSICESSFWYARVQYLCSFPPLHSLTHGHRVTQRFFELRNPLVGLLDPALHTPQYVHSKSFTLFSVVCALGCALSNRPRDRLLYPTLAVIADANIRWSMATFVKSLETVQALILFAYWGPAHERQGDDPYWLRLSHVSPYSLFCPASVQTEEDLRDTRLFNWRGSLTLGGVPSFNKWPCCSREQILRKESD